MPIAPNEIDASKLHRTRMGGYDAVQTDEFLRTVSWDYQALMHTSQTLKERVRVLEAEAAERAKQLEEAAAELERRKNPEQLAKAVLEASQRVAADLRASTRQECEAALKKAHRRANEIEVEIDEAKSALRADIVALEAERERARTQLHTALTGALEALANSPAPTELTDVSPAGETLVEALHRRSAKAG